MVAERRHADGDVVAERGPRVPRDTRLRAQAARGAAYDPGVAAGGRPGGVHVGAGADDQQLAAGPDRRRRRVVAVGLRALAAAGAGAAVRVRGCAVSGTGPRP